MNNGAAVWGSAHEFRETSWHSSSLVPMHTNGQCRIIIRFLSRIPFHYLRKNFITHVLLPLLVSCAMHACDNRYPAMAEDGVPRRL